MAASSMQGTCGRRRLQWEMQRGRHDEGKIRKRKVWELRSINKSPGRAVLIRIVMKRFIFLSVDCERNKGRKRETRQKPRGRTLEPPAPRVVRDRRGAPTVRALWYTAGNLRRRCRARRLSRSAVYPLVE